MLRQFSKRESRNGLNQTGYERLWTEREQDSFDAQTHGSAKQQLGSSKTPSVEPIGTIICSSGQ